ncbi:response regulator [uncultured Paraglaciecola sp.]|jgi:two-component system response regulator FixJ|uniref:response regulator transcription factor n=1 Tax=uncultured Paraglaciecola sp. TaxID=1765024 RepID=UPI002625633B|nr:response regulator [uncultured Paraglaciecola sp.]
MLSKIKAIEKPIVYIVDSDHKLLCSLSKKLVQHDVIVEVFSSAEEFLNTKFRSRAACLIIEVNLPNMGGIELLEHINNLGVRLPTFILSSSSDISKAVRAMQAEAIDFIEKPFIENTLIEKVLGVIKKL